MVPWMSFLWHDACAARPFQDDVRIPCESWGRQPDLRHPSGCPGKRNALLPILHPVPPHFLIHACHEVHFRRPCGGEAYKYSKNSPVKLSFSARFVLVPICCAMVADRGDRDVAHMQVHKQPVAFFTLSPVILFPLGQHRTCGSLIPSCARAVRAAWGNVCWTDIRMGALGGGVVLSYRIGKVTVYGGTDEHHAEMHCPAICDHAVSD